jgi:hypothetical protein
MYMYRLLLISMFLTSAAFADTWTVDDDGKADFENISVAVDAGPLRAELVEVMKALPIHRLVR